MFVLWEFSLLRKRETREPVKLEHATFDATVSSEGASLVNEIVFFPLLHEIRRNSILASRFDDFPVHTLFRMCAGCVLPALTAL